MAVVINNRSLILEGGAFSNDEGGSRGVRESDLSTGSVGAFARKGEFTGCDGHITLVGELADGEVTVIKLEGVGVRVLNNCEGRGFNSVLGIVRQSKGGTTRSTARGAANGNVTQGDSGSSDELVAGIYIVCNSETGLLLTISDGGSVSL